jgi:hypothetical protein
MNVEFGMRNAECGKNEIQTFNHIFIRIPHSNFRIPETLNL